MLTHSPITNNSTSLPTTAMASMSSFPAQILGHTDFWLTALLLIFCVSIQLKQEQNKNHELRTALLAKREATASREDALRKQLRWARGDLEFTESLCKCAQIDAKKLRSKLAVSKADRDRVNATLESLNKKLERKEAAIEEAKTKISLLSAELRESLEKKPETDTVSHQHECTLCMNADVDALFACGHVACCMTCAFKLAADNADEFAARCPFCREKGQFKKVYFA